MSNQEPATILLIDDHPMLRTGVNSLSVWHQISPWLAKRVMANRVLNWRNLSDPDLIL